MRASVSTPLAITGASALVHLKVPQTVAAFVRAKAQGTDFVKPDGAPDIGRFAAWAGAFTALAFIAIASEGSPTLGEPMAALMVLIATTGTIVAWQDWIDLLHITPVSSQGAPPQAVGGGAAGVGSAVSGHFGPNAAKASWASGTATTSVGQSSAVV